MYWAYVPNPPTIRGTYSGTIYAILNHFHLQCLPNSSLGSYAWIKATDSSDWAFFEVDNSVVLPCVTNPAALPILLVSFRPVRPKAPSIPSAINPAMSIHPIEFRYGTREMKAIWEEDFRLRCLFRVEAALARAEEELGMIPQGAAEEIARAAETTLPERAKQIEDEIGHDMMATVLALAEQSPNYGEWIHLGATSNDILDTATGLQIRASLDILEGKLKQLLALLLDRAMENRSLVCAGRTHGQIAVPTTYGLRFAIWASEVGRHIQRLMELRPRAAVGKMSGAVGTQAAYGQFGM